MREKVQQIGRRVLAFLLTFVMIGGAFPTTALAANVTVSGINVDDTIASGDTIVTGSGVDYYEVYVNGQQQRRNTGQNRNRWGGNYSNYTTGAVYDVVGNERHVDNYIIFTVTHYTLSLETALPKPTVDNVTVTVPEGGIYDGQQREAQITAADEGLGELTIVYKQGDTELTEAPKNAGDYTFVIKAARGTNFAAGTITSDDWAFTIDQRPVGIVGVEAEDKDYDGTTAATLTGGDVLDKVAGDDVAVNAEAGGQFEDANASEEPKNVTFELTNDMLTGEDAANYTVVADMSQTVAQAKINKLAATVSAAKDVAVNLNDDLATAITVENAVTVEPIAEGQLLQTVTMSFDPEDAKNATNNGQIILSEDALIVDGEAKDVTANYDLTYENGTFVVAKADPTAEMFDVTLPTELTYDGQAKEATAAVKEAYTGMGDVTVKYFDGDGNEVDEAVDAGDYTVKLAVAEGDNYNATVEDLENEAWTFTITKADPTAEMFDVALPTELTYNGQAKEATVTVKDGYNGMGDPIVKYVDEEGNELDEAIDAGVYTVKFGVEEGDNYNATAEGVYFEDEAWTFEITPKTVLVGRIQGVDKGWDGTDAATLDYSKVLFSGIVEGDTIALDEEATNASAKFADKNNVVEPQTVTFTPVLAEPAEDNDNANYFLKVLGGQTDTTAQIFPSAIAVANEDMTYDGNPWPLVHEEKSNPAPENYKLKFATDEGWTEDIPNGTDAGDYPITYGVFFGEEEEPAYTGDVTATIAPQQVKVTWNTKLTYNATPQKPTAQCDKCDVTVSGEQTNVGTWTATATSDDPNYEISNPTTKFTIDPAKATITAKDKTINFGAAPANAGVTYDGFFNGDEKSLTGTLKYTYNYKKGDYAGTYKITPSGLSSKNYTIKYNDGTLTVTEPDTVNTTAVAHVQNKGNLPSKTGSGQIIGTTGQSLRMESLSLSLPSAPYAGSIKYRAHVQNKGWMAPVTGPAIAGTQGKSLRMEAIRVWLDGEMAKHYDVWYRAHVQNLGWMAWAKGSDASQFAGTTGKSLRLEAVQVVIQRKGSKAPATTLNGATQNYNKPFIVG